MNQGIFCTKPRRGSNPARHKVGEKVTLFYDPGNPQLTKMEKSETGNFFSGFLFFLGAVSFFAGGGMMGYHIYSKKQTS